MADTNPQSVEPEKGPATQHYADEPVGHVPRPEGWMYKKFPFVNAWYASPRVQLGMVAFVCFLCPGMFNALSGMGGGGKANAHTADQMVRLWTLEKLSQTAS